MAPGLAFLLKILRLGADNTSAVASNLGASALDRGDATTASICIAITAAFTAVKSSAEYYLDAHDQSQAEEALLAAARQHGSLRNAIRAISEGRSDGNILSDVKASAFLDLLELDPSDTATISKEQSEILFQIARWLEDWRSTHEQTDREFKAEINRHFGESALAFKRLEAIAAEGERKSQAAHKKTQDLLTSLPGLIVKQQVAHAREGVDSQKVHQYIDWTRTTTATFSVPGIGVALPIENAWAKLKATKDRPDPSSTTKTLADEVQRYHEWERLASRNDSSIDAELILYSSSRIVIIAGPGAGKSTLLRRLAHRYSLAEKVAVRARLSLVAQRIQFASETFEIALATIAADSSPLSVNEMHSLLEEADYLLLDGLDESDPVRPRIAEHLVAWSKSHPNVKVVVTTRPVGHDPGWIPDWHHFELLPLDSSAVESHANRLINACFSEDIYNSHFQSNAFRQRIGKSHIAALAARNPLLLCFLVRLSLDNIDFHGYRSLLYNQVIELMLHASDADRQSSSRVDDPLAWRILELLAWHIQENPGVTKSALTTLLGDQAATELGLPKLQGAVIVSKALLFWEHQRLLETISCGSHDTVTFVHLSLQEFAAARYTAKLPMEELQAWVERVHQTPKFREILLLSAGCGAGDAIATRLLDMDVIGHPVTQTAVLAAAALGEYAAPDDGVVRRVTEHLMSRLTSDIPLVVFEAAVSLLGLARQLPTYVGPLAKTLQLDRREWVRFAGIAVGVQSGKEFVDISLLLDIYQQLCLSFRSKQRSSISTHASKFSSDLHFATIEAATEIILDSLAEKDAIDVVECRLSDEHLNLGGTNAIKKVLRGRGHSDVLDRYSEKFRKKQAHLRWSGPSFDDAEKTFLRSILSLNAKPHVDSDLSRETDFAALGSIAEALKLNRVPISDFVSLSSEGTAADPLIAVVVKGVVSALGLSTDVVASEARAALLHLKSGGSPLDCFPEMSPNIDWTAAISADLNLDDLVNALYHRSSIIVGGAANLLEAGAGGPSSADAVEAAFANLGKYGLWAVSQIAGKLWGSRTLDIFLKRLNGDMVPGCQYLLKRLSVHRVPSKQQQIDDALIRGLRSPHTAIVQGAASSLQSIPLSDGTASALREAFIFWEAHEPPYPEGTGIIPNSPRPTILEALLRNSQITLPELFKLSNDVRSDVSSLATSSLIAESEKSVESLAALLAAVSRQEVNVDVLAVLAASPSRPLAKLPEVVKALLQSEFPELRVVAVARLSHPWLDANEASDLATKSLMDSDPVVRDQAVVTLRLLHSSQSPK